VASLIRHDDVSNHSVEGAPELHGLHGCEREGVVVDATVGVVDNGAWPPLALGDDADRAETEVGKVGNVGKGEDTPMARTDHVGHVLT